MQNFGIHHSAQRAQMGIAVPVAVSEPAESRLPNDREPRGVVRTPFGVMIGAVLVGRLFAWCAASAIATADDVAWGSQMGRQKWFARRHGGAMRGPLSVLLLAVLAAVGLLTLRERCSGFGTVGHQGVYGAALLRLRALDAKYSAFRWNSQWIRASDFPDHALTYENIPENYVENCTLTHPLLGTFNATIDFSEVLELVYALNSSDHYFDPTQPERTAEDLVPNEDALSEFMLETVIGALPEVRAVIDALPEDQRMQLRESLKAELLEFVKSELPGFVQFVESLQHPMGRTWEDFLEPADGKKQLDGTDGNGYNAVSAILFYLNGRVNDGVHNPSGLSPSEGFIPLAKNGQHEDAAVALGCAAHYVADLFSAGHTDWEVTHLLAFYAPAGPLFHRHDAFDDFGDRYFRDFEQNTPITLKPILSFASAEGVCTKKGGPETSLTLDFSHDIPRVLKEATTTSRNLWKNGKPESAENREHLNNAVAVTAGVIDWAFSRAADKADAPYKRDATNFFGMAAALLEQKARGAVIVPKTSVEQDAGERSKDCTLGGIDTDDYFPLTDNKYQRIWIVWDGWESGAVEAGEIKAEVWDASGKPLAKGSPKDRKLEIDLGKTPPSDCLLRVYSPNGGKFRFTFDFSDEKPPPSSEGMLDVVVLIDKSGSMVDDIECVQREVDTMLGEMASLAEQQNISLQVGLVLFRYDGSVNTFEECRLSTDIEAARQFVKNLNPQDVGGDEDLYSALMYCMNRPVAGRQIDMGWRQGAAKITIPITDEPPKDDNFNILQVAEVAFNLDPVHMYPLIMPKDALSWLLGTERSLNELAQATGGEAVKVRDAGALPAAIVGAVELAIRRHREEIWRQENPPYGLYAAVAALACLAVCSLVGVVVGQVWQRHRAARRARKGDDAPPDPTLTGDVRR